MGCALRDADGGAVQALEVLDAAVALHDKALSVVEVDRTLPQAEGHTAQIGLRGIAIEHVDLARLQCREPVLRRERDVTHLAGITEHSRGQRAAIVDVEPLVVALGIRRGEPGEACAHAAHERAALLDRVQRCGRRTRKPGSEQACSDEKPLHFCSS